MNLIEANQPKRMLSWSKAHLQADHIFTTLGKPVSSKMITEAKKHCPNRSFQMYTVRHFWLKPPDLVPMDFLRLTTQQVLDRQLCKAFTERSKVIVPLLSPEILQAG